jgi:RNA polymerase sigma-70 factor (ECF subfamily)
MSEDASTDHGLLEQMKRGDEEAFASIYRRYHRGVFRFALQMSGSTPVAEDVTQDAFLSLMRHPEYYDAARGALGSYLYGIARNLVLRHLTSSLGALPVSPEEDDLVTPPQLVDQGDPLTELMRDEAIDRVRQAVLALPLAYREVVVLCELHEMNYAEAALVLGCPLGTVRSRLSRGRELLVRKLRAPAKRPVLGDLKPARMLL